MMQPQPSYPYMLPYHVNLPEEQALDWHLERFYNLCIFQKPPLFNAQTKPGSSNNDKPRTLNQAEIGLEFFGSFVKTFSSRCVVDFFIRLYLRLPYYLQANEMANQSRNFSKQGMQFQQFFFQNFLIFFKLARQNERDEKRANIEKAKKEQQISVGQENTIENTEYVFTDMERDILIRLLIRIDFPPQSKIWTLCSIVGLSVLHKTQTFPQLVKEAAKTGDVAFWALHYAITRCGCEFEDVGILAHLIMLDRINARVIEEFLSNRSEEDKTKVRQMLLTAEGCWANSFDIYRMIHQSLIHPSNVSVALFEKFREDLTDLMRELRREPPRFNLISISWAKAAIRIQMEKYYIKKEATIEQLYDIVYTIVKQRPQLRNDIVQAFKKHNDPISAEYWTNFYIDHRVHQFEQAIMQSKKNTPPGMIYRPNNSIDMYEIRENFLSIPPEKEIIIIDNISMLPELENRVSQAVESDYAVIGLDSEWSAYVSSSRASILQIAFRSAIVILDLDLICANKGTKELTQFVDNLFKNPKLLKIGFQFGEDLIQLRKRLPNCMSLYEPVNLIDVSKVVSQLIVLSQKNNFSIEDYIKFPAEEPVENTELPKLEENLNDSIIDPANTTTVSVDEVVADTTEDADKTTSEAPKEEKKLKNLGLSTLCQYMLGKSLDKAEQCSVWNRRPLRKSQIRYSSLDAYAILMLYDRCSEWAEKLNLKIVDITDAQDRIKAPLPLFFDASKLTDQP